MQNQTMGDKERVNDAISSQKQIESTYNTFANECVCNNLRQDFLSILKDEHDIQYELFKEMQNRNWYQVKQAPQNEIVQTKNKFSGS